MIYLDNSATTQPFERVISRVEDAMRACYFNPSAAYAPALEAEKLLREARAAVAAHLRCVPEEIIFTSGGTEADNLAILGSAYAARPSKRTIITTAYEHPAVLEPCAFLQKNGWKLVLLPVHKDGSVDEEALYDALDDKAAVVSLMQVNNEVGAVSDIARISGIIRSRAPDTRFHVDAVQGYARVELLAKYADLISVSAHKIHGPKGIGALYVRKGIRLAGVQMGGGQEGGLRSGAENVPGAAGFGEATAQWTENGAEWRARMAEMKRILYQDISGGLNDIFINGPDIGEGAPHILNLSIEGVRGETLLHALEEQGIYVGMGSACSSKKKKVSHVLSAMGLSEKRAQSALRFSLSPNNTIEQMHQTAEAVCALAGQLRKFRRN